MRKGQIAFINSAKKYNYSDEAIKVLSREDYSLKMLKTADIYVSSWGQKHHPEQYQDFIDNQDIFVDKPVTLVRDFLNVSFLPAADRMPIFEMSTGTASREDIESYLRILYKKDIKYVIKTFSEFIDYIYRSYDNSEYNDIYWYPIHMFIRSIILNRKVYGKSFKGSYYDNLFHEEKFNVNDFIDCSNNLDILYDSVKYLEKLDNCPGVKSIYQEDIIFTLRKEEGGYLPKITITDAFINRADAFKNPRLYRAFEKCIDSIMSYPGIENPYSHASTKDSVYGIAYDNKSTVDKAIRFAKKEKVGLNLYTKWNIFEAEIKSGANGKYLKIVGKRGDGIYIDKNGRTSFNFMGTKKIILIFHEDGGVYRVSGEKPQKCHFIPASLATICRWNLNWVFRDNLLEIIAAYVGDSPFAKDVLKDIKELDGLAVPVTVSDLFTYHNRAEFFKKKYHGEQYAIGYNTQNISLSYLIIKSLPYVKEGTCQEKLKQLKDFSFIKYTKPNACLFTSGKWKSRVVQFLAEYIANNIATVKDEYTDDVFTLAADYVDMCLVGTKKNRTPVNLLIKSRKKLEEAHQAVSEKKYLKCTKVVKIPKKSQFNDLKKKLPDSFEQIKTRKRLIHESAMQHHCVWSYADAISNDKCAIYSFMNKGIVPGVPNRRYTIEFCKKDGVYYIQQARTVCNEPAPQELIDYIKSFIG